MSRLDDEVDRATSTSRSYFGLTPVDSTTFAAAAIAFAAVAALAAYVPAGRALAIDASEALRCEWRRPRLLPT